MMMMMMNWDGLEDDDEFFESNDRISSALTLDVASSGSDNEEDEYDDSRMSFVSTFSSPHEKFKTTLSMALPSPICSSISEDYNIWMATPGSIKERRKRLHQGMGLGFRTESIKRNTPTPAPKGEEKVNVKPCPLPLIVKVRRSKSEGRIGAIYVDPKHRNEQLMGAETSIQVQKGLTRSLSVPLVSLSGCKVRTLHPVNFAGKPSLAEARIGSLRDRVLFSLSKRNNIDASLLIKNLDTGKEFVINDFDKEGMWNKLCDLQTGKELTMEEFDKSVGHSPIVMELMRREHIAEAPKDGTESKQTSKTVAKVSLKKHGKSSKKKGVNWLKNIKDVANTINGMIADRERSYLSLLQQQTNLNTSSKWTKVHQQGKSFKELTGLYMCQEIIAHMGSIWSIKFSSDARYLASAGEDRVIHIWEVVDCGVFSSSSKKLTDKGDTIIENISPALTEVQVLPSEKKRRGKISSSCKKGSSIPEYVAVPETVFSLSEKPVCSFQGHLDDVLDLSWSKSQQLLSSSMDKTVRLWDMESRSCLKLFAHNDYDERYFISGSLDAKVRIWSIPDRQVVDWTDLHEMVTSVCYTPDGQGALVGSHKGSCRLYDITDCKLSQKSQIDVQTKKKSQGKKITGFQFAPGNSSEVLITSADSRIRVLDGSDIIYKFTGFRNTSSQISASFTTDGKYVVCASENSQVYIWKRDENRNASTGKSKGSVTIRSHEHFQCKDVSVAIPWPGTMKCEPPLLSELQSNRHYSKCANLNKKPTPSSAVAPVENAITRSNGSRRNLPPFPNKTNSMEIEEDSTSDSHSSASGSGSFNYGDSLSNSASDNSMTSLAWLLDGGSNNVNNSIQSTAWGLVVVTAGLGGRERPEKHELKEQCEIDRIRISETRTNITPTWPLQTTHSHELLSEQFHTSGRFI
ncbi:hypothetical protein GIB67_009074 [Kingdonia uniflora]|uniref:WD repeat-containing protein 44-like n=1 Tax=Kingdonia uniflora TaxID=39325 RepID=A0A7J7MNF9_9MAGN|nr:hypothetical protein GIB67_009074 [Kingdonia uniflora]